MTLQIFDDKMIEKLRGEKKMFKKQWDQSESNVETNNFMTYFLLSSKFIKEWKQYSGYDPDNLVQTPAQGIKPSPFNQDISNVNSNGVVQLNSGLNRHIDFEVVSPDLMAIFREHYQGNIIQKRIIRRQSGDKVYEIYQIKFQYFFISQSIVRQIDCGPQHSQIQLQQAQVSRYLTMTELKNASMKIFENSHKAQQVEDARMWKLNSDVDIKSYYNIIKQISANQTSYRYFIQDPRAIQFQNPNALVQDFNLLPQDIVMIQIRESDRDWVVRDQNSDGVCSFCQFYLPLRVRGPQKSLNYCTFKCRQQDKLMTHPSHKSSQCK